MVGSAVCRSLYKNGYNNVLTVKREKLDLRDDNLVKNWFINNKPDIVILAAAKVGGINANNLYPVEFLINNL